ncbi:MAG TPA: DUF4329 domain-containing protein [Blastocatellia bacterium]|nr:DUF4329 domain-containing protein [Blastocatellia bacterium]
MSQPHNEIFRDPAVRAALEAAWLDSAPGVSGGHEEGGFVITNNDGTLSVVRWPVGERDLIAVPPHPNCEFEGSQIVASFHTHPNTGEDYLQEPSETDKRGVRDDQDLKAADYVGEFVVSCEIIFLITPAGRVREVAETRALFAKQ